MDWTFAQRDGAEHLARLHHFSLLRHQEGKEIEFQITVYEYVTPPDPAMPFFAIANKQTNQKTIPFTPSGWGKSLLEALSRCREAVMRFPYEGE